MVRIDSVNGADPDAAKSRVEFSKLVPLYPDRAVAPRDDPDNLIGRVIDIAAPVGRGSAVSSCPRPRRAKTMIMQSIANSITTNNPEVHLMVVLVTSGLREVTDFSALGQGRGHLVDLRPAGVGPHDGRRAGDRAAKRPGRAGARRRRAPRRHHPTRPRLQPGGSGQRRRIPSGGVDSAALYPPKKFFGAARNIETAAR